MMNQPKVTVIVLNYNGLEHLEACFSSLLKVDYPKASLELMLMDNGSSDGSVAYVRENYPRVRIVRSDENLGFAGGNNFGVQKATGDYVAFLNNDMRVHPGWVKGLLTPILEQDDPNIVCTSAKILGWEGKTIDFAGGMGNIYGLAFQRGFMADAKNEQYMESVPILFACGGAMLIHRRTFLDVGGFDDDYFIYYEDLDLGWRLWVMGYQVLFAPEAIVYHRHHATMDKVGKYQKQILYDRNSLYTVVKNYNEDKFARVFPIAMLSLIKRLTSKLMARGQLDKRAFRPWASESSSEDYLKLDKSSLSSLIALDDLVEHLPQLMKKRKEIQRQRRRSDKDIFELFRHPFKYPWTNEPFAGVHAQAQSNLMEAFGIIAMFKHLPRRVLIVSSDILPYPGLPTTGAGLRAWGLGQGLITRGHDVVFSMPSAALSKAQDIPEEVANLAWEPTTLTRVVLTAQADALVICNWPVLDFLDVDNLSFPVILDQHGPHYLEREFQGFGDSNDNAQRKISALRKADFFTCAGNKQLAYFHDWLHRADWTEEEIKSRAQAIPVSLSPELPQPISQEEFIFVYGGVFLPWQDPSVSLLTLVEELNAAGKGELKIFGGKHPIYQVDAGVFEELSKRLETSPYVHFAGMVSHDELIDEYRKAYVAIDLMKHNSERELAFTTRTVEYLWCGLPVIYNNYAELSEYIHRYDAGWIVDPEDREAIMGVIREALSEPDLVAQKSANAQRLVRECLTWDNTITPLDAFIREPTIRQRSMLNHKNTFSHRAARHLLDEAAFHYRRGGIGTLLKEGMGFLRRGVQSIFDRRKR
jgi:GT2 family glycosyltransferase